MKKKIIAIFVSAILLTGLFFIYLSIQREKELALHWLTENSRSQLDLMGDLLDSELDKIKNQMAQIATMVEAGNPEEAQKNLGGFTGVAALNIDSTEFIWKVQQPVVAGRPHVEEWSSPWVQKLREIKGNDTDVKFYASQAHDGEVHSAISVLANVRDRKTGQINKIRLIGIRTKALFQDLIDKLKDQGVHVFLTTQGGLTLAHTVTEYVGNSMVGDRTYEEIKKQKSTFGSMLSQDARGEDILSFYLKLPKGKITLVSQWRKELWVTPDWGFYGQGIFIILAMALLSGALAHYFLKRMTEGAIREVPVERIVERVVEKIVEKPVESKESKQQEKEEFERSLPLPSRPHFLFAPSTPAVGGKQEANESWVSLKVLDKVVASLRAPLLSVLGHVQMARLNPQGGALQAIETEVRNARDVLDNVGKYSGQAQVPSMTVPLHELIESALRIVEGGLLRSNVKIVREIPTGFAMKCDIDEFKNALAALFRNSAEAMEKNLRKTLFLRATERDHHIILEIEDTGEGIVNENKEKIFDPFFTTKSTLDHSGLGLSMAMGIFRQHNIQVQVKSKVGEGTIFSLKIPVSNEVVQTLDKQAIYRQQPLFETTKSTPISSNPGEKTSEFRKMPEMPTTPNLFDVAKPPISNSTSASAAPIQTTMASKLEKPASFSKSMNVIDNADTLDSFSMFDDEDGDSDFQFSRLDFIESKKGTREEKNASLSLGERTAQEVIRSITEGESGATKPSKKLKKKDEIFSNLKVQIPRPEEKI